MLECDCEKFVGAGFQLHVGESIKSFLESKCKLGEGLQEEAGELIFQIQRHWRDGHLGVLPGSQVIGRHLRTNGLRKSHRRVRGEIRRVWVGVKINRDQLTVRDGR
jgi:hypothetical protein